jgi:DNA recombination protein RmuC
MATLRANAAHFDEQKRLLLEAQDVLRQQFEAAGARVLEQAQDQFLKRAQERFSESEKTSAQREHAVGPGQRAFEDL